MSKAEIGAGDIKFTLGKEELVLKPSLEACTIMTTDPGGLFGGENSLYARVRRYDIAAMAKLVRLGLGAGLNGAKNLEEMIYEAGLINLRDPLEQFMAAVVNGGKVPNPEADDEESADPQPDAA